MFVSRYMPCPSCGASLERGLSEEHVCEHERWLDFQMFQLRAEVEAFDGQLSAFLQSPHGRFEVWYALRERRRAA